MRTIKNYGLVRDLLTHGIVLKVYRLLQGSVIFNRGRTADGIWLIRALLSAIIAAAA